MYSLSCNADSNPYISGTAQKHYIYKNKKVYPKDVCQSITSLPVIPGTVGSAWGTIEEPSSPVGLKTVGLLIVLFPLLPIYGAFLILFHTHSFSSLSLGLFHRVLQRSLMRGKNTTAMKSPRLLRAFFSKLALSSPPERFLQISVWGIVNTNFSLLKSPHIPAMLSFEWRTQGRPLNSFIVGFKTLHFKKYKSYSQMNEGERGDWREGLLMCPVGQHELNLLPELLKSTLQWDGCSVLTTQLNTRHLNFLQNANTNTTLDYLRNSLCITVRNIKIAPHYS